MPATRTVTRHFETLPPSSLRGKGGIILSLLSNEAVSNIQISHCLDFSRIANTLQLHRFYLESVIRLLNLSIFYDEYIIIISMDSK